MADLPDLWAGLERYMEAFNELSAARDWVGGGMGAATPKPITPRERMASAREIGIGLATEEYDEFAFFVKHLDGIWLEAHAKIAKRRAPARNN